MTISEQKHPWKPWGVVSTTLFGVAALFFSGIVASVIETVFLALPLPSNSGLKGTYLDLVSIAITLVVFLATLLVVALAAYAKESPSLREYVCLRRASIKQIGFWLGVTLISILIIDQVDLALEVDPNDGMEMWQKGFFASVDPALTYTPAWWMVLVITVFIGPVSEETLFRGFLMRGYLGLDPSTTRKVVAVILTAILFAIVHSQYSPATIASIAGLGIIWGLARVHTGSLLVPIVLHAASNYVSFLQSAAHV